MWLLLLAAFLIQEPTVDDLVRSLSSDDPGVREKALKDLGNLGLDKLPQMEKHLGGSESVVAIQVRAAMRKILASNLGSKKARFEIRPAAPEETTKAWIAAGADVKNPPKGFEARRLHPKDLREDGPKWMLVEAPIIAGSDVKDAMHEPGMSVPGVWSVRFTLKADAGKRFDEMAARLFALTPRGAAAILLDDLVIAAPIVNAAKLGGEGVISGNYTEAEAKDLARALRGDWLESSLRAERVGEGPDDKAVDYLQRSKGFDRVKITPDAKGLDVSGYLDLKQVDLLKVWQDLRERGYRLVPKK